MMRKCGGDPTLIKYEGDPPVPVLCDQGCEFDDAECSVIYPHAPLPPKMTEAELSALYEQVFGEKL